MSGSVRGMGKHANCKVGRCALSLLYAPGTTPVECKKLGIPSIGLEANHMGYFASTIKTKWDIDYEAFQADCIRVAEVTSKATRQSKIEVRQTCLSLLLMVLSVICVIYPKSNGEYFREHLLVRFLSTEP